MSSDIVFAGNFRTDRLSISAVKTLDSGAKQAYVNYDGKKFLMQTPVKIALPYGLNVYEKPGSPPEFSLSISFRGYENTGSDMQKFHAALQSFDEYMIEEAYKNRKLWFKGVDSKEVIRAFYTPSVKIALDKQGNPSPYPPSMKAKIRKINGAPETKFYNEKGVVYTTPMEELLQKGSEITAILQCAGLWFAGGKFGVTWRAIQVVVHKVVAKLPDFAFQGLPDVAEEEEEAEAAAPVAKAAAPKVQQVDDSDLLRAVMPAAPAPAPAPAAAEEEEEAHEAEDVDELPAPKPKVVIKKKIIAKAK
jgi:hypothetical protein